MSTASARVWLVVVLLTAGCDGTEHFPEGDFDRARGALATALESWKQGEAPETLRSLAEPIDFAEEWPKSGIRLLDYDILDTESTDAEIIRYTVILIVQERRGEPEERRVTYAVALRTPIVVCRDPYY